MKYLALYFVCFFSTSVFAAQILSAQYNQAQDSLRLELAYSGGEKQHQFSLLWDECQVAGDHNQIAARLIDAGGDDTGDQEIFETIEISLSDLNCRPAWLTIRSGLFSHKTLWVP